MDSDLVHLLTRLLSGGHRDRRADELRADEPAGHRLRHEPRGRDGRGVRLLQLLLLGRRPPRRPDPLRPFDDLELVLHGGGRGRRRVRRDRHEEVVPRPDRLGRLLGRIGFNLSNPLFLLHYYNYGTVHQRHHELWANS